MTTSSTGHAALAEQSHVVRPTIGVLGPVVVWPHHTDRPHFPKGREARLLAALALDPGRPVWREQLIDVVWGRTVPKEPRAALHNVVYRLRRIFEELDFDASVAEVGLGYSLAVPADSVDCALFERLAARSSQIEGRSALPDLETALGLWRGSALEGIGGSSPYLLAAAERLMALRLSVFERWCQVEIQRGSYGGVVPSLRAAAVEYPWSERVHGLLMVALYGAGRQRDALHVMKELTDRLVSELGIVPEPVLQDLELAILDHDVDSVAGYLAADGRLRATA